MVLTKNYFEMKKLFTNSLTVLFIFSMFVVACGEKDFIRNENRLHGTWNYDGGFAELKIDGEIQDDDDTDVDDDIKSIEFNSDGSFIISFNDGDTDNGTWSLSNDGKVLTIDGERFDVEAFSRNSLTISQSNTENFFGSTIEFYLELRFKK